MSNELKALLAIFAEARELGQAGRHEEARRGFLDVQRGIQRLGLRSSELLWYLAVANDYLGQYENALVLIRQQLALDPISTTGLQSKGIIAEHARRALADPERPVDARDSEALPVTGRCRGS